MDRAAALDELAEVHAVALRLRDAGHNNTTIATALGVEVESVGLLLHIAEAKLARLTTRTAAIETAVENRSPSAPIPHSPPPAHT